MNKILLACLMLLSLPVLGQDKFYQGPGEIGRRDEVAGTVVGIHPGPEQDCYWLCSRCVLVFHPPRANTDGGVEASKPRAANTALK